MSKGNQSGLFVDTGLLREHIAKLQEEKKLASRLYESIACMKAIASPEVGFQLDLVLRDIEQLVEYFRAMAKQLTFVADEATQLSHELRGIIVDSTNLAERIAESTFVL